MIGAARNLIKLAKAARTAYAAAYSVKSAAEMATRTGSWIDKAHWSRAAFSC
jgi:hypothetical protein